MSSPTSADVPFSPIEHPSLQQVIDREHRSRRRRTLGWSLASLLLIGATFGGVLASWPGPPALAEQYRVQSIEHGTIVRNVAATGRVDPRTSVEVGAQISGRIETIEVDHNDRVTRGQVLARFDADTLEVQAVQARANVAAARATHRRARLDREDARRRRARTRRLREQGIESDERLEAVESSAALAQAAVDQTRAQVDLAEANLRLAQTNLAYAEIRSPIDGVVISRSVEEGQTVVAALQSPVLFVIADDLSKMVVVAAIDEADIGEVRPGQRATFTVDAFRDREFSASVTELRRAATIVQNVVTYEADLAVDNSDLLLLPGMTASIEIETATVADAVKVPNAALRFTPPGQTPEPDRHTVWLLRDGELTHVHVTPGISDGIVTAVSGESPFLPGDDVLVDLTLVGRKLHEVDGG